MGDDKKKSKENAGKVVEGINVGIASQTRFSRIPKSHLNKETVAGIRDMKLGRVRAGKPIGAPVVRFDTGANTGTHPHINVDPKGFSSAANPHFNVEGSTVNAAKNISKHLGTITKGLLVVGIAIDLWRVGSAIKRDCDFKENPDKAIKELEKAIEECKELLKCADNKKDRDEINEYIELLKNILNEVRLIKRGVPAGTIKTVASIGTSYATGAAGGWAGATAGAEVGAFIGTCVGPAGTVVGGICGAIVGGIGGGIGAAIVGSKVSDTITEEIYDGVAN